MKDPDCADALHNPVSMHADVFLLVVLNPGGIFPAYLPEYCTSLLCLVAFSGQVLVPNWLLWHLPFDHWALRSEIYPHAFLVDLNQLLTSRLSHLLNTITNLKVILHSMADPRNFSLYPSCQSSLNHQYNPAIRGSDITLRLGMPNTAITQAILLFKR